MGQGSAHRALAGTETPMRIAALSSLWNIYRKASNDGSSQISYMPVDKSDHRFSSSRAESSSNLGAHR
jgi:hypothetical protein